MISAMASITYTEAAARAIHASPLVQPAAGPWPGRDTATKNFCRQAARAAIASLRLPDDAFMHPLLTGSMVDDFNYVLTLMLQADPLLLREDGDSQGKRRAAMSGVIDIAVERQRQITDENWSHEHDDQHRDKSLALVAALYATPIPLQQVIVAPDGTVSTRDPWPWHFHDASTLEPLDNSWDKRKVHDERRRLVIAGALIAAEIDRIDRAEARREPRPANVESREGAPDTA